MSTGSDSVSESQSLRSRAATLESNRELRTRANVRSAVGEDGSVPMLRRKNDDSELQARAELRRKRQRGKLKRSPLSPDDEQFFNELELARSERPDVKLFFQVMELLPRAHWIYVIEQYLVVPIAMGQGKHIIRALVLEKNFQPYLLGLLRRNVWVQPDPDEDDEFRLFGLLMTLFVESHFAVMLNKPLQGAAQLGPMRFLLLRTLSAIEFFWSWNVASMRVARLMLFSIVNRVTSSFLELRDSTSASVWNAFHELLLVIEELVLFRPARHRGQPGPPLDVPSTSPIRQVLACGVHFHDGRSEDLRLVKKVVDLLVNVLKVQELNSVTRGFSRSEQSKMQRIQQRAESDAVFFFKLSAFLRLLEGRTPDLQLIRELSKLIAKRGVTKLSTDQLAERLMAAARSVRKACTVEDDLQRLAKCATELYRTSNVVVGRQDRTSLLSDVKNFVRVRRYTRIALDMGIAPERVAELAAISETIEQDEDSKEGEQQQQQQESAATKRHGEKGLNTTIFEPPSHDELVEAQKVDNSDEHHEAQATPYSPSKPMRKQRTSFIVWDKVNRGKKDNVFSRVRDPCDDDLTAPAPVRQTPQELQQESLDVVARQSLESALAAIEENQRERLHSVDESPSESEHSDTSSARSSSASIA
ncbi:MAG: hypothetical protein MHM6MM_001690 [Cercozoa sp. M6MM]